MSANLAGFFIDNMMEKISFFRNRSTFNKDNKYTILIPGQTKTNVNIKGFR